MHETSSPLASLPRWLLPATLSLVLLLMAGRNLPWHLDDYDQAKQAYVSFEMVQEGHWWFQHTPAGRIATKPPLAGWVSAGLAKVSGGAWDFAWRFPPFLCGLIMLGLCVQAGRAVSGETGAVLAAAAFGLNTMTPRLATLVRTDMILCLPIFLAGYLIYQKLRRNESWQARDRWGIFFALLVSCLIKGPMAYAFLAPGLLLFSWLQRRSASPGAAWAGWWCWLAPLLFFGVWVGLGIYSSHDFYEQVVLREFLGRFEVGEAAPHHNQSVFFYLFHLLGTFFPWALILIVFLSIPEVRARIRREPSLLWLVCWAGAGLLFMSLVPSKRMDRVYPVILPCCLLVAGAWPLLPPRRPRYLLAGLLGLAVLWNAGYAGYQLAHDYRTHQGELRAWAYRARAAAQGRSLAVVSGRDEGMLLYLGLTHFTRVDDAAQAWKVGALKWCVLPEREFEGKAEHWDNCVRVTSVPRWPEKNSGYVLIGRSE